MSFKMPTKSNLKSRTSTITNAFTISITPYIKPTNEEISLMLELLGIKDGQCVYCLRSANSTDHFRPLVENGEPTGYISDINNLVPCCGDCNSSKGKKNWSDWFMGEKNISKLKNLGFSEKDIRERYNRLEEFSKITNRKLDYKSILGDIKWNEFIRRKNELNELLKENQRFCDTLKNEISEYLKNNSND